MSSAEAHIGAVAGRLVAARVIDPKASWHPFAAGADNIVFTTRASDGADVVVKIARPGRRPRYEIAGWAATRLANAGVPVPARRWSDDEVLVETRCPGMPLSSTADVDAAHATGRLLWRLHSVPVTGFGRLRPGGCGQHTALSAWLLDLPAASGELADRARVVLQSHASRLHARVPCLLHGDFTARHVILDAANEVTGVVDLESVRGGDPLADLAGWSLQEPTQLTAALLDGYFPDGPTPVQCTALAVYRVRIALSLLRYHHTLGDTDGIRLRTRQLRADLEDLDAGTPRCLPTIAPHTTAGRKDPA